MFTVHVVLAIVVLAADAVAFALARTNAAVAATTVVVGEPMPAEVVLAMVVLAPDAVVFALARTDASAARHPTFNW